MKTLLIGNREISADIKKSLIKNSIFFEPACSPVAIRNKLKEKNFSCVVLDADAVSRCGQVMRGEILRTLKRSRKNYIFVTSDSRVDVIREAKASGAKDIIFRPYSERELILRISACYSRKTRISCIGGGTGLFNLLVGLKKIPNVLINSIVSMTDDGGSSGRLRESFGTLPPGDVRMSLVALSNAPTLMNQVLQYRFKSGGKCFLGHNIGNIILVALSEISGSIGEGIKNLGDILNLQGIVIPVTTTNSRLNAVFEDSTVIKGETNIDLGKGRSQDLHIKRIWHDPKTECTSDAYASIINSDAVIIGPGDLYTSVLTNLVVGNVRTAIAETDALKIYICNLMTKPGETADYGVFEHVREVINYLGGDYLDYVIVSNTRLSSEALNRYEAKGQFKVSMGNIKKINRITKAKIILADVGHETDLIRHNSDKISSVISKILGLSLSFKRFL